MRRPDDTRARPAVWWAAVPPVLLTALFFFPVTQNYFFADDFIHLFAVADGRPVRTVFRVQAGHVNVTFNTVFYLVHALFGPDPAGYHWVAFLTHLLNVALLFRVLVGFFASERIACLGAALWGVCPAHEATVGWFSVYGQSLTTTLTLLVLCGVTRPGPVAPAQVARWGLLILVAATCFGVGVGVAIVFPLVLWLLAPEVATTATSRWILWLFPALPVALYVGLHALAFAITGDAQVGALPFLALVSHGWEPSVRLLPQLINAGLAWLGLGLVYPLGPYPGRAATTLITLVVLGTAGAIQFGGERARRQLGAFALLALAAYGTIALGRGFILLMGQDLAALGETARYHYFGTLALTLALGVVLTWLGGHVPARWSNALLPLGLAAGIFLVMTTDHRIDHHDDVRTEVEEVLTTVRRAVDDGVMGRRVFVPNRVFHGVGYVRPAIFPGWVGVFMIFSPTNVVDGRHVRFVGEARAREAGVPGGRLASLLVVQPPP